MGRLGAVIKQLRCTGPEAAVSLRWLLRTGSRLDRRFKSSAKYTIGLYGAYTRLDYEGETYLWPRNSNTDTLLMLISELTNPHHPHQYLYGPTQLRPDDVVLDIGACEGAFAARVTGRVKRVITVEPSRLMCSTIRALFELRGQPTPILQNCLLGSRNGIAHFLEHVDNSAGGMIVETQRPGSYEIPIHTLDDLVDSLDTKPTFIKCDAEGAEPAIFSGGATYLRRHRPRLAITTYHHPEDYRILHAFLTGLGYNVLGKGSLYAHGTLIVQMIHAW